MAEIKSNRQIIIVDNNTNHQHNPSTQNEFKPSNSQPIADDVNLVKVQSHRKLSPTLPTEKEMYSPTEKEIYQSPMRFLRRKKHKVVVYSASEDQSDGEGKQKNGCETQSNKETKPAGTIEQPSEQIQQNRYDSFDSRKKEFQNDHDDDLHLYQRRKRMKERRNIMKEESESEQEEEQESYEDDEGCSSEEELDYRQQQVEKKEIKRQVISRPPLKPIELKMNRLQVDQLIMKPVPKGYKLGFSIKIESGFLGLSMKYHLCLGADQMVILSAKKQIVSMSPNYIISKSKANHSIRNQSYIGHLKANFSGSQWTLNAPKTSNSDQYEPKFFAKYGSSLMGSKTLRKMNAFKMDPEYRKKSKYNLTQKLQTNKKAGILAMNTRMPSLVNGKYKIDFKGKAKMASNKNFILENSDTKTQTLLLGKQAQNVFYMEVKYPLTVFQGFGLSLTSLDAKILVN